MNFPADPEPFDAAAAPHARPPDRSATARSPGAQAPARSPGAQAPARSPGAAAHQRTAALLTSQFPADQECWRTAELLDAGVSARALHRLVETGSLVRLDRGCYVRGVWWREQSPQQRLRLRLICHDYAKLSVSRAGFVYSHTSAARLHGLFLWHADELIHITRAHKSSSRAGGERTRMHTGVLTPAETTTIGRLTVTSLERTVLDCCLVLDYRSALILTDHALRLGASLDRLRVAAAGLSAHRGVRTLRKVLRHADGRSESPGETLTRDLLRELLIETPELQFWITTRRGRFRADFAWPGHWVILEFDGRGKYFDYRPTDEAVFLERKREAAVQEAGWRVLRIEWRDLFDAVALKRRVLAAFAAPRLAESGT